MYRSYNIDYGQHYKLNFDNANMYVVKSKVKYTKPFNLHVVFIAMLLLYKTTVSAMTRPRELVLGDLTSRSLTIPEAR